MLNGDGAVTDRRCAVLGSPIGHSLSPALHRAAYRELGLDWSYEAVEVAESGLTDFLDGLDGSWRGLSLTMPLKRAVVPLLDEVSETVSLAGAANTVLLETGRRSGENTDVPGAAAALRERWAGPVTSAVVLGGGATAAAVILALAGLGCREVILAVRDAGRVGQTLEAVTRHPRPPTTEVVRLGAGVDPGDVLVSTIPASAQDEWARRVAAAVPVVFDVVYHPWPTPVAEAASTAGRVLVSGLDLLVHQAARQVELMTGAPEAPLRAMRAAGQAALAERV